MSAKIDRPQFPDDFPYRIIRKHEGPKYFGLGPTALEEEIAAGHIPPPLTLSAGGRAKGWLGSQILAHHERLAQQEDNATPIPDAVKPGG
jgi:predicted DNA-binding transcriptional regulator AlpA